MSKDNPTLAYFDAEIRYLREAAKEYGAAFPDRAAALNLDKPGAQDPAVEQLFQGFAFLMGRLREKLDDDLPELTEGLMGLVRPQYLRMIPSLSIVEFSPDIHEMKACETIRKGFEVRSQPVGAQGTRCRYTSTQDLTLRALSLDAVEVGQQADGRSVIRLRFSRGKLVSLDSMDLRHLLLYLNASAPVASALHQALTLNAGKVYVRKGGLEREEVAIGFGPGGFGAHDRLWPQGDDQFGGCPLLLEYFSFPEKFMFVTLNGLEHVAFEAKATGFELEVVLDQPWPRGFALSAEHVRLHAVPVINLFALEADPLSLDPLQTDYRVRSMEGQDSHAEIYSVDSVIAGKRAARHEYVPFTHFQHRGGTLRDDAPERYFHTRLRRAPGGSHDTWLILGGDGFDLDRSDPSQRLTLQLTGTNGDLPRMALAEIMLDQPAQSSRRTLTVRNLCAPTMPCYAPDKDRFHWRVLSHLGSSFLPLLDSAEVLRNTLALYDWTDNELNRRRLQSIVEVRHHLIQRFEGGFLLRGVDIEVTLEAGNFAGEGDICLFGELLSRFFAQYADIHLFNQLTLILQPQGKCLRWSENHSQRVP
ncbi:type VI secretion system baseplate subunit TssF, partial [Pseudomonas sp.]|uniref:type VI secretion system baseplate subunit TssF n=1 Tax=Pseudomonas sp. TaxID=306 RepID=UPI002ED96236